MFHSVDNTIVEPDRDIISIEFPSNLNRDNAEYFSLQIHCSDFDCSPSKVLD